MIFAVPGTSPIFTINEKHKQTIKDNLKRLGASKTFPQSMISTLDTSQYYDLKKVFDINKFPQEHHLIRQMEEGIQKNFPDVISGHQQSLLMLPDNVFHYGKGRDKLNIHVQLIFQRIKEIEERINFENDNDPNPISSVETEERQLNILERDHMKNLLNSVLTEQAEMDVYHRFHELLHNEIGFMIHGYLPETYLNSITTRAKQQRKNLALLTRKLERSVEEYSRFIPLEEKLQDILGLTSIISGEADAIFSNIQSKYPGIPTFTAKSLQDGIKDPKNKLEKLKKSIICDFMIEGFDYDRNQAWSLIAIGLLHYYANRSGEMDLLICLPEYQAILNIEVKYQLNDKKDAVDQAVGLLEASTKQVNAHDDYLTRVHGRTFSTGWKFHKISAVLPGTALNRSDVCNDFPVITSETLKSKDFFFRWFQTLGLIKTYKHKQGKQSHPVYKEYNFFFRRVVGSMHLVECSQSSWHKVVGPKFKSYINPTGDTESYPVPPTKDVIKTKDGILITRKHGDSPKKSANKCLKSKNTKIITTDRHWDMENRPLDAEMTIFLTGQQSSVLLNTSKRCLKTLLFGDFGSGILI